MKIQSLALTFVLVTPPGMAMAAATMLVETEITPVKVTLPAWSVTTLRAEL